MAAPVCVPEVEAAGSPACPAHLRGRRQELRDGEFWRARKRERERETSQWPARRHAPRYITRRENWPPLHTGNLDGADHTAEGTGEDVFLRQFLMGIFPACLANQLIVTLRDNQVCSTLGDSGRQGTWPCCRPWGGKESDNDLATEQQQPDQGAICDLGPATQVLLPCGLWWDTVHFYKLSCGSPNCALKGCVYLWELPLGVWGGAVEKTSVACKGQKLVGKGWSKNRRKTSAQTMKALSSR